MPITPAHIAAVLPLVGRRARWIVPAAWVVGSMAPDLVYFTPVGWVRPLSHSWTGLMTLDPALGLVVLLAWWRLVGPATRDLLPRRWRVRVAVPTPPARERWGWVLVGLFVGSLTHVVWDAFTHHDGSVVERVAWLREAQVGSQPGYSVLQEASGAFGLVAVAVWGVVVLRGAAPDHDGSPILARGERIAAGLMAVGLPVGLCAGLVVLALAVGLPLTSALFLGLTRSVGISAVVILLASGGWHVLRRRRRAQVPAPV